MSSAVWFRLALVIAAIGVLGAVAATFLPTKPEGITCGTWMRPEWSGPGYEQIKDSVFGGAQARASHDTCEEALTTRRNVALVFGGVGFVGPLALMFVSGAYRRDSKTQSAN